MASMEDIRAAIAAEELRLTQETQAEAECDVQLAEAYERQRLRRRLDTLKYERAMKSVVNARKRTRRDRVDEDREGPAMPGLPTEARVDEDYQERIPVCIPDGSHLSCSDAVTKREYLWKIEGMSWITHALYQDKADDVASSPGYFQVGSGRFDFVYHPQRGLVADDEGSWYASLAIRRWSNNKSTLRYKIFIQRNDGEFIQWGPQGDEPDEGGYIRLFGPDVQSDHGPASGVFGLSHEALLQSEWVHDDTFTVKFELEVRAATPGESLPRKRVKLEVPPLSMSSDFLSMLEEGKLSDVSFVVKGQTLKAHSQVLAARCEVFEKQFQSGMRESVSREVVVEDCEPDIFKALLQFLYSDDFSHVTSCMKKYAAKLGDSTGGSEAAGSSEHSPFASSASFLQEVLSVSNKYQVTRLSIWCQQQLCDLISEANVCSVLKQAHLCEAKVLEDSCLTYIKEHLHAVAPLPSFAHLTAEWPELLLKISLFGMGLPSSVSAS
eukprot:CAMPEP_0180764682 /NCGR_PEP_ID=MMETSP1038_2-20121128/38583_1 /TAXON_ID=632150 /ORGANISM="Azadinium spinosum, Strain 3D9" /LENGTH=494 /DNA_ID=CAMNT_0022799125 /DNA_START=55 /DNA_END=1535 /DNA_ORIENTATION=+